MKKLLSASLALALSATAVGAPCEAFAVVIPQPVDWQANQSLQAACLVGAIAAIPSLATNAAILVHLAKHNEVPYAWSVLGTSLWTVHLGLGMSSMFALVANNRSAGELGVPVTYTLVSVASLAISYWGLTRAPGGAGSRPRVSAMVIPTVIPDVRATSVPGVGVVGAF